MMCRDGPRRALPAWLRRPTGVRRVSLIGQQGNEETEETWLVFSREIQTRTGGVAGHVEIAFWTHAQEALGSWSVRPVSESPLVVFFPTVLETRLGFLVQGPYRTTPSRDNVPGGDPWNQRLVRETAVLAGESLIWLREHGMLDEDTLRCYPMARDRFSEGSRFAPVFEAVRESLNTERLLPCSRGGHVAGVNAILGRSEGLRNLCSAEQLSHLYDTDENLEWLSGGITRDRTPDVHTYLVDELGVREATPQALVQRLSETFLTARSDEWITALYEFLSGQTSLLWWLRRVPVVRLDDGRHVFPEVNNKKQAFLPTEADTRFPTVRRTVCASEAALAFLLELGLTEPDPVDDVILNVLPRYDGNCDLPKDSGYEEDIRAVLRVFGTDSKAQIEQLISDLRESRFVAAVDAGDGSTCLAKPGNVYIATERLKALFEGTPGVLLVDDSLDVLRGDRIRDLLEKCGAQRYLRRISSKLELTEEQLSEFRKEVGCGKRRSYRETATDSAIDGLKALCARLGELPPEDAVPRARLLWESLDRLHRQHGDSAFRGEFHCGHTTHKQRVPYAAGFVKLLNSTAWVPDSNGELHRPEFVVFDSLGWPANDFLCSKVSFKPADVERLAEKAGFEPALLDHMKRMGITDLAQLIERLGDHEAAGISGDQPQPAIGDDGCDPARDTPAAPGPIGAGRSAASGSGKGTTRGIRALGGGKRAPGSVGRGPFISYVAAHPTEAESDHDGLDHASRMDLEKQAIQFILEREPHLQPAPVGNPGYDLYETDDRNGVVRWVEVKAMTGTLQDRPVGLTHPQFEHALEHGGAFWLYVVERVSDAEHTVLHRIQDPAGKARTFTFDRGWTAAAAVNDDTDG